MKLDFKYNINKDVENFIKTIGSLNNKNPTKFHNLFFEKYGNALDLEKIKIFIKEQSKINNFDADKEIAIIKQRWESVENLFIERTEKIFGIFCPEPIITAYLTHNERCSYNIKENYFFVKIGLGFSNNIIMHELLHFYTYYVFGKFITDEDSKLIYNDIKESLTELLNLEFSDLLKRPDYGYPQHQEMRAKIKELWLDNKDIKIIFNKIFEDEKVCRKDF